MNAKKICWIDVETTGLHPYKNDIIQLALMIEADNILLEKRDWLIQPFDFATVDEQAMKIQKRIKSDLYKFDKPQIVYGELIEVLSRHVDRYDRYDKFYPAGYNVGFDVEFLKNFFKKNGDVYYGSFFNYRYIDPLQMLHLMDYAGILRLPNYKLETVCKYFGIALTAHDALKDVAATYELMNKLGEIVSFDTSKLQK